MRNLGRRKAPPHICAAGTCQTRIPRSMLMCKTCWFRTPRILRDAIVSAWKERRLPGRLRDYSRSVMEARRWHADNPPAPVSAELPRFLGIAASHPETFHG